MGDWSKPGLSDTYTNFLAYLKDRDTDSALMFDGVGTNVPTGAIKWNSGSGKFQKWNGSAYVDQVVAVAGGGTGGATASAARTGLGLVIGSDVQAYSTALNSIAGLTTSSDKMIYTTASNSYAVTPLTAFSRTLLNSADANTARNNLGLSIGGSVMPYDPGLFSIAALTTVADRMLYTTASDTYAVTTLTSFARTLLDDADAGSMRATLGLGIGGDVQAFDAGLTSIAGLSTAADKMIYTTALDTYSVTSLTSLGRSVVGSSTLAALQSTVKMYPGYYSAGLLFPSGWSASNPSTGNYRITHSLGVTSYSVVLCPVGPTFGVTCEVVATTGSYFDVRFRHGTTDSAVAANFMFMVVFAA